MDHRPSTEIKAAQAVEAPLSVAPRRDSLRKLAAAALGTTALFSTSFAWGLVDPQSLPEPKRTKAGRYLTAREVPAFIDSKGGPARVLFLDVRTRAEAMFVGMATDVDALVPFVELQELMTDWDAQRNTYKLEPLQDFVPETRRRLQQKGLTPQDVVVLICRSGDRSSRAANRLEEAGFAQVWSVVDGFEGDLDREGRRNINGWKNAGLPWSYKLDRERMYFPR